MSPPSTPEGALFPASMIPASAHALLPSSPPNNDNDNGAEGEDDNHHHHPYRLRPLARDDHARGFYDCLSELTRVTAAAEGGGQPPGEAEFRALYDEMAAARGTYHFLVIERGGRIVGTGQLVVERKFIHGHTKVGHVEEIAVAAAHRGRGLGRALLAALDGVAASAGCSKSVLSCGPRNEAFYADKCGYRLTGSEMTRSFFPPAGAGQ